MISQSSPFFFFLFVSSLKHNKGRRRYRDNERLHLIAQRQKKKQLIYGGDFDKWRESLPFSNDLLKQIWRNGGAHVRLLQLQTSLRN